MEKIQFISSIQSSKVKSSISAKIQTAVGGAARQGKDMEKDEENRAAASVKAWEDSNREAVANEDKLSKVAWAVNSRSRFHLPLVCNNFVFYLHSPNLGGLVLGCIEADFCKTKS